MRLPWDSCRPASLQNLNFKNQAAFAEALIRQAENIWGAVIVLCGKPFILLLPAAVVLKRGCCARAQLGVRRAQGFILEQRKSCKGFEYG